MITINTIIIVITKTIAIIFCYKYLQGPAMYAHRAGRTGRMG